MSIMESTFLQFQRFFKMKYFRTIFNQYYDYDILKDVKYDKFMYWCNSRDTTKNAVIFCKLLGISDIKIKPCVKMLNLLIFSNFFPILFENNRTKELEDLSNTMIIIRDQFFIECKRCLDTDKHFNSFIVTRQRVKKCLLDWEKCGVEWREYDKCLLVQDCIVQYIELMNLEEQLQENEETDKNESKLELNRITLAQIKKEKITCKRRVKCIDGERGMCIMNQIVEQISISEKNEQKLSEQIKIQMEKAFWNRISDDIETESFIACQLHIKELVEECSILFNNNVSMLDTLVEQLDFDFMKQRCYNKTTDARYWYSIFIPFLGFLKDCDARENERIYLAKIDELYLWTEQLTFEKFKHIFLWIKYRIKDIYDRKQEFELSPAYKEWKRERNL